MPYLIENPTHGEPRGGRGDFVDVTDLEKAEHQIDQFTERRAREAKAQRETEELYAESVRRFHKNRHHQNAKAWYDHHDRQLRGHEVTFGALVAHHRAERDRYARILGFNAGGGPPGEAA